MWVAWSGVYGIAANTGIAYWKASGIGVALEQNPIYDELGVARPNTAMAVLRRGVVRVTAADSGYANSAAYLNGMPMRPVSTGSGIVGQTGATGQGAVWQTAALASLSATANFTGAVGSLGGVATLVGAFSFGDVTANSVDIVLNPQQPFLA